MGSHRGAALGVFIAGVFIACVFIGGVATDVIDGWWARRTGTSSERGARLDSIADTVFVAATTRSYDPNNHGLLRETIARSIR